MSTVGKSNNSVNSCGFTLIELIVVISVISVLLVFSFPVVKDIGLFSEDSGQVGDMVRLIEDLKIRSVEQNLDYQMHVDTGAGSMWITDESMDLQQQDAARAKAVPFSDQMIVSDVEFPVLGKYPESTVSITFRKQGYSDFALIHIMQEDQPVTIKIEPFLIRTQQLKQYVSFEDCI